MKDNSERKISKTNTTILMSNPKEMKADNG
jgi:hypothetical protein